MDKATTSSQRAQNIVQRLIIGGMYVGAAYVMIWSTLVVALYIGEWRMAPVCADLRPVNAQEQHVIDTASGLLCTVEALDTDAVSEHLCTLLRSGDVHFVTQSAAPSIGMTWFCRHGETTARFQDKHASPLQVRDYTIMLRRDLLTSVAQTSTVLTHEATHAAKSSPAFLIEPERYAYEICLDENAVRDKTATWGIQMVRWITQQEHIPEDWRLSTVQLAAIASQPAVWTQLRTAMTAEIQALTRQTGLLAPNAPKECSRVQRAGP